MRTMTYKKAIFDKTQILRRIGNISQRERDTSYGLVSLSGCMRNNGCPLLSMPRNPEAIKMSAAGASW